MHILFTLSPWIADTGVVDSQIGTSLDLYMFRVLPLRCSVHVLCSIRKKVYDSGFMQQYEPILTVLSFLVTTVHTALVFISAS